MREEGVIVHNIDGNYAGLFGEKTTLPPQILRHRPDAFGINSSGHVCIGEAKTEGDITNTRTYEQLHDFATVELNGAKCDVYVGLPQSCEYIFKEKLKKLGLRECENIHALYIPDEIIND